MFLTATLGDLGLTTYLLCMDILVIASIVDMGVSETLTSIVPIYYSKHDYVNLNHLIKNALIITYACAIVLTIFIWVWPEGFLALYNFNKYSTADFMINAVKWYSLFFILSVLPNMLIFYYEAIERSTLSTILSTLFTLLLPLATVVGLYNVMGSDGI